MIMSNRIYNSLLFSLLYQNSVNYRGRVILHFVRENFSFISVSSIPGDIFCR